MAGLTASWLLLFEAVTGADGAMILACVALAAAAMVFIFYIEPDPADSAPHRSRLDQLMERRDTIYENLRDLKFEHRSGKFSDGDFEEMKRSLENEAAVVLAEIESVTGSGARRPRRDSASASRETLPEKSRS